MLSVCVFLSACLWTRQLISCGWIWIKFCGAEILIYRDRNMLWCSRRRMMRWYATTARIRRRQSQWLAWAMNCWRSWSCTTLASRHSSGSITATNTARCTPTRQSARVAIHSSLTILASGTLFQRKALFIAHPTQLSRWYSDNVLKMFRKWRLTRDWPVELSWVESYRALWTRLNR